MQRFYAATRRYDDGRPLTRHLTTNMVIDVDETAGVASARSAFIVFQATQTLPLQPIVAGRYRDRFRRGDDGTWAFTERCFAVDLVGDLSEHLDISLGPSS